MITNPIVGRRVRFTAPGFGTISDQLGRILLSVTPGYETYARQVPMVRFDNPVGISRWNRSADRTDHPVDCDYLSYVSLTPEQEEQERIVGQQRIEQERLRLLQVEDQKRRLAHAMKFL